MRTPEGTAMRHGILIAIGALGLSLAWPAVSRAGLAADVDSDGIPDVLDKCSLDSRNASMACDSDCDGYGNVCDGDFDQNFYTNPGDFEYLFVPAFKGFDPAPWLRGMDMDCNGAVNANDFGTFWVPKFKGPGIANAPGPSGLACAGQPGCGC